MIMKKQMIFRLHTHCGRSIILQTNFTKTWQRRGLRNSIMDVSVMRLCFKIRCSHHQSLCFFSLRLFQRQSVIGQNNIQKSSSKPTVCIVCDVVCDDAKMIISAQFLKSVNIFFPIVDGRFQSIFSMAVRPTWLWVVRGEQNRIEQATDNNTVSLATWLAKRCIKLKQMIQKYENLIENVLFSLHFNKQLVVLVVCLHYSLPHSLTYSFTRVYFS